MMQSSRTVVGFAVTLIFCLHLSAEANGAAASFQALGDLLGGGFSGSIGGISADGSVVVGTSESALGKEAFYWTQDTGVVGLGDLPGGDFDSGASMVSGDGSVIVGRASTASGYETFRWTIGTGMVGLGNLGAAAEYSVSVRAMSDDGLTLVGSRKSAFVTEAFRYTEAGGMIGLGVLPEDDFEGAAFATSADGSVIAGTLSYLEPGNGYKTNRVFRWTEATGMVNLLSNSVVSGISADGSTIVGWDIDFSGIYPFRWVDGQGFLGMNPPGSAVEFSIPFDLSADGSVVVGDNFVSGPPLAAIWDEVHGTRFLSDILTVDHGLDLTGWELSRIKGVSDDGLTVVGWGINPDGDTESFIATLPEPGVLMLMAVGTTVLLGRRG